MVDEHAIAFAKGVFDLLQIDFNLQRLATVSYREPKYRVISGCATRPERQNPAIVSHTAKPIGKHHPGAAHRSDMATVLYVTADVGEIHQECRHAVSNRSLDITDLRRDDRFDTGRQRRVTRRQGVIEIEVPP